jgi:Fe2+ or Zn2+ uptake regulation protein
VSALAVAEAPLTIPEILERHPDLAQSSVYRNLTLLERAGVAQRVAGADEWGRYELAEDLTGHHHHLICASCGLVRDVTVPERLETLIDEELAHVAGGFGFTLQHHRLDLFGLCEQCRDDR